MHADCDGRHASSVSPLRHSPPNAHRRHPAASAMPADTAINVSTASTSAPTRIATSDSWSLPPSADRAGYRLTTRPWYVDWPVFAAEGEFARIPGTPGRDRTTSLPLTTYAAGGGC